MLKKILAGNRALGIIDRNFERFPGPRLALLKFLASLAVVDLGAPREVSKLFRHFDVDGGPAQLSAVATGAEGLMGMGEMAKAWF